MSKEMKKLLPVVDSKIFGTKEEGEVFEPRYLIGLPQEYRFDAGKGVFNIKGTRPVTIKPGAELKLIPLAYRIFEDAIFKMSRRKILEIFFINSKGAVAVILFHGYSVDNFMETLSDLFYEECLITDCLVTVSMKEKYSKAADAKYWIASFEAEELEADEKDIFHTVAKDLKLYRMATMTPTNEMISWVNYPNELIENIKIEPDTKKIGEEEKAKELKEGETETKPKS